MKTLIIFYSFDGNTKFLAEIMAKTVGADLLELKPEKEIQSHGFSKYLWGGKQVLMRKLPKLLPYDKNPNDYDLIIVGGPVWASTFAPTLKSFFSQTKIIGKKVGIFCSCAGSPGRTLSDMKKELSGNDVIGETHFVNPLKNRESVEKSAVAWVNGLPR
jgi:flavodoxin